MSAPCWETDAVATILAAVLKRLIGLRPSVIRVDLIPKACRSLTFEKRRRRGNRIQSIREEVRSYLIIRSTGCNGLNGFRADGTDVFFEFGSFNIR